MDNKPASSSVYQRYITGDTGSFSLCCMHKRRFASGVQCPMRFLLRGSNFVEGPPFLFSSSLRISSASFLLKLRWYAQQWNDIFLRTIGSVQMLNVLKKRLFIIRLQRNVNSYTPVQLSLINCIRL